MPHYVVEMHGEVRELYSVEADTEEEATANWSDGDMFLSEAQGMGFYSVKEEDA